ncbi:DUF4013 domain-containing protein [Halorubrum sp. CSM-61]|uniref:DUF4013 domain-containing protein n=1 Tax=Halorubrum sp. CSM-61 TaxID=2485838 RepID=UPI000F4B992B|nr:DUF4013 domain-containing protein [Halorubrum sp. CSM-61]
MLRGTATALTRSADGTGVLVVGGVLTLLAWVLTPVWVAGALLFPPLVLLAPLALAPAFVARGYFVRLLAGGIATGNADGAPPVVAWNDLYRDGLKAALVSAVLLAPLAFGIALAALAGGALGTGLVDPAPVVGAVRTALGEDGVAAVVGVAGGLSGAVAAAYLLAFAYVRPAALAAFAASGRLRDGLRPRRVARVAGSGAYATAWVVAAGTLGAGYALAGPFVPLVVGAALVFAVRVAAYGLYGRGAAATLEVGDAGDGSEATDPTAAEAAEGTSDLARPSLPEVPPAVQTGRTVSLGGVSVVRTGATEARTDGSADRRAGGVEAGGGFEWYAPEGESAERDAAAADGARGADGAVRVRNAGSAADAPSDDEFEWSVDVADPEDKS